MGYVMNYTQWFAQNGKFQKHEQWLVNNLMLETIVGSHAYGCQNKKSDYDITAIILPKHEHLYPQNYGFILGFDNCPNFKRKEFKGKKIQIGNQLVEAEWISLIEFFIEAGLKSSPNLIECLFVRRPLVTVGTRMGWYLRDNRQLFLSMRTFHAFKGYANGQMHRIRQRNPETEERRALIDKHGYDCYIEKTEFLTDSGWKVYDEITNEKLATVEISTNNLEFQSPISRIKRNGKFKIYKVENNFTKFSVTENHNILNSPCHRSKTIIYDDKTSNWTLTPIKYLNENKQSWYHLRTSINNNNKSYGKDIDELTFIGIYLAEGSICFRDNKIKDLRISQTKNGKKEVFDFMRRVKNKFELREYTYRHKSAFGDEVEETIWSTHKKPWINEIYNDFGKVKTKRYPAWILNLSEKEADSLRFGMFIGDGTEKKIYNQEIYYSTVKALNDLYQLLALLSGYNSNVRGPYYSKDKNGKTIITYQTLVNVRKKAVPRGVCFNTRIKKTKKIKLRGGKIINYKGNIVCFEVPNKTLVTRLDGKIAIQGNSKMAYHALRLLDQLDQILTVGDIDLMRNKEEHKAMRAGEWGDFDRFDKEFQKRMDYVEDLSRKCSLPSQPQEGALKKLLAEILEEHYSSEKSTQIVNDEYISVKDINKKFDTIIDLLKGKQNEQEY